MIEELIKCKQCNTPIMSKIEDISGVELAYNWNPETKEYEEMDRDYYGDCTTRYECPNCGEEIEE